MSPLLFLLVSLSGPSPKRGEGFPNECTKALLKIAEETRPDQLHIIIVLSRDATASLSSGHFGGICVGMLARLVLLLFKRHDGKSIGSTSKTRGPPINTEFTYSSKTEAWNDLA
jgi:hypothetical protein